MLTKSLKTLYDYICEYYDDAGCPPSYDEMQAHLGLKSKSGIHHKIVNLETRGYIKRIPFKSRAIIPVRNAPSEMHIVLNEMVYVMAAMQKEGIINEPILLEKAEAVLKRANQEYPVAS